MAPRSYDFAQLDVFTRARLAGNPLAVFPDGRGLTDAEMQAIAREMNLSETTFILPREKDVDAHEGNRVRIFTVAEELPFAGHPTLGTALYIYAANGGGDQVVLDLNVGKVPVRFTPDSENAGRDRVDGKVFGQMRQRDPEFGPTLPREQLAQILGISADEIASEGPIQVVSTGLPFAVVPIRKTKTLAALQPNITEVTALLKETAAKFCYFLSLEKTSGDQTEIRARMFFYGGEDPATGSAAGCAASWLARYGVIQSGERALIRQGVEAGRPSDIFVSATRNGDNVTDVRVGGYAVEVLRGTLSL